MTPQQILDVEIDRLLNQWHIGNRDYVLQCIGEMPSVKAAFVGGMMVHALLASDDPGKVLRSTNLLLILERSIEHGVQ